MRPASDAHLETALAEYNDKVNELELGGDYEQLLEAYVNRGSVFSMMESYVSALTDFDDALDLIAEMNSKDIPVDAGTFVKAHIGKGTLLFGNGGAEMKESYMLALTRIKEINSESRHYDRKGLVKACRDCAEDLIDENYPEDAVSFISIIISKVGTSDTVWDRNRLSEAYNLLAQSYQDRGMTDDAIDSLSESIIVAKDLLEEGQLDDTLGLVYAFITKGDLELEKDMTEQTISDYRMAIILLEEMSAHRRLQDVDLLVGVHQELAKLMIASGKMEEAEKHLVKAMELSMNGASDYISNKNSM